MNEKKFKKAVALLKKRDYSRSKEIFRQIYMHTGKLPALEAVGLCLHLDGQHYKSSLIYRDLIKKGSLEYRHKSNLFWSYYCIGLSDQALKIINRSEVQKEDVSKYILAIHNMDQNSKIVDKINFLTDKFYN